MSRAVRVLVSAVLLVFIAAPPAAVFATGTVLTTTTVTASPSTADAGAYGGTITWTINVSDTASQPVTGTGTWTLAGPSGTIASNTFNASQADVTVSASGLSAGTYRLTASYAGDATYAASSGFADGTFAMVATTTTVTVNPATADAGAEGGTITWTINVTRSSGTGAVSGTGTWTLTGPSGVIASNSFTASQANVTVSAAGLSAGTYTLSASFAGNSTFTPSSDSAAGTFAMVATTTTVTVNPATADAGAEGGTITWKINVTRNTGSGPVAGTGTWTLTGPSGVIASNTFTASQADVTVSAAGLSAGTYTLGATYPGDTTFGTSSGSAQGTFTSETASVALTSSLNPSVHGQPVTFTATVSGTGGTPTGSVTFRDGSTPLGTVALDTSGTAMLTTSGLSAGSHDITADYAGDSTYVAVSSATLAQVVHSSQPPVTTASLAPAANPAGWNSSAVTVTLTAAPAADGAAIDRTYFAVDDPACTPTARTTCSVYTTPFAVTAEGVHTVTFFSTDTSGVVEALRSLTIRIDHTAPATTATLGSTANAAGWFNSPVTVTFAATDALSGVDHTESRLDAGSWTAGTTASISTSGIHTLEYRSVDRAGNVESAHQLALKVDVDPPVLAVTPRPGTSIPLVPLVTATGTATFQTPSGQKIGTVPATCFDTQGLRLALTASDAISGAASITYSATGALTIPPTTVAGTAANVTVSARVLTTVTAFATDLAGLSSPPQRWAVLVSLAPTPASCAMPLGALALPSHGLVTVTGRIATGGGTSIPYAATFRY